jgi:hypothetical protein
MGSVDSTNVRLAEIAEIVQSDVNVAAIRKHVKEILQGPEFKGSPRCGKFLQYVVDRALAGDFEALKERALGAALFGRPLSYNNVDDPIVRVTASDVRKRLRQHYGQNGTHSTFRLDLPAGHYVPEFKRGRRRATTKMETANFLQDDDLLSEFIDRKAVLPDAEMVSTTVPTMAPNTRKREVWPRRTLMAVSVALLILIISAAVLIRSLRNVPAAVRVLPWSILFHSKHATQLIVSDPDIARIEEITGKEISVTDYAHHNYIPEPNELTSEERRIIDQNMGGFATASLDAGISAAIGELAHSTSEDITVQGARRLDLSAFNTDDNFILLGSPFSNPWSSMFSDQLDFQFVLEPNHGPQRIRNLHPGPHEELWYTETPPGQALGEEFAIVAFVQNPDHNGQILLLAGEGGQGTQAAGDLVTDLPRLSAELQRCGINPHGPLRHFEFLLRLTTTAGSLNHSEVVACHILDRE